MNYYTVENTKNGFQIMWYVFHANEDDFVMEDIDSTVFKTRREAVRMARKLAKNSHSEYWD